MSAQLQSVRPPTGLDHHRRFVRPVRTGRVYATELPATRLLAHPMRYVDWSDSYAVGVPLDQERRDPQEWADALFRSSPPLVVRALFGVRELLVRAVGIERGGRHVFTTVSRTDNEVLLGVDQSHLGYRASVLVEPGRVVVSTRRRAAQPPWSRLLRARPQAAPVRRTRHAHARGQEDGGLGMSPVKIVRRHPLVSFYVLACLIGWYPYILTFLRGGSGAENVPLGPIFATLTVVSCQGREDLRRWGRRLRSWAASPRWYLLALLAPLVLQILFVLANHGFGAPLPTGDQLADWPEVPVTFLVMLVFVGYGEEAGWIAFVAPVLLGRHGLFVAWVIAATMRTLWHLPLMLTGDLDWVLGTVGNAAFSMVALLLFVASDGRWALAAVWHASLNATGGLFFHRMVTGADHERIAHLMAVGYALVALVAFLVHLVRGRHLNLCEDPAPTRRTAETAAARA